jgi:hypothetical protein
MLQPSRVFRHITADGNADGIHNSELPNARNASVSADADAGLTSHHRCRGRNLAAVWPHRVAEFVRPLLAMAM